MRHAKLRELLRELLAPFHAGEELRGCVREEGKACAKPDQQELQLRTRAHGLAYTVRVCGS
jgi:hypothetical protein